MNMRILPAAAFVMAATISAAAAAALSGTWIISGPATPTCTFTQTGDFFRGPCDGPGAQGVAFGIVDGQTVRWSYQWTSKTDGSAGAFEFMGKLDSDDQISGAMLATTPIAGPFKVRRRTNI